MREFLRSRDDDGFNLRGKPAVCIRDASLILEIEHVAYATHYVMYAQLPADIYGQAIIIDSTDPFHAGSSLADDVQFLLGSKESSFILVHTNSHHDFVEHRERARENIEVSLGKRIEGPRE